MESLIPNGFITGNKSIKEDVDIIQRLLNIIIITFIVLYYITTELKKLSGFFRFIFFDTKNCFFRLSRICLFVIKRILEFNNLILTFF